MKGCRSVENLLPLYGQGDLAPEEFCTVANHLTSCPRCRATEAEFSQVIALARRATALDLELTAAMRQRIVEQATRPAGVLSWLRLSLLRPWARPGLLASAAALMVALVALPVMLRHEGFGPSQSKEVSKIEVRAEGRTVHLAWSDGVRGRYTVYKSDNPRSFRMGEAYVVKGNMWTDPAPESSAIVFYRVE